MSLKKKCIFLSLFILGCLDQIFKLLALSYQESLPIYVYKEYVGLYFLTNTGAAWGIFSQYPVVLFFIAAIALSLLPFLMRGKPFLSQLALSFVWVGAASNAIDRLVHGFVIDYIYVWPWPVFNIADLSILVGVFLLLFFTKTSKKQ